MGENKYNYSRREYNYLKSQLNPQELKKIEELEKNCEDVESYDYWEIYRKAHRLILGELPHSGKQIKELCSKPIYKLMIYLIKRAAKLRGVKLQ